MTLLPHSMIRSVIRFPNWLNCEVGFIFVITTAKYIQDAITHIVNSVYNTLANTLSSDVTHLCQMHVQG